MAVLLGTNTATGGGDFFGDGDMYGSRYQCVTTGSVDTLRILVGSSAYTALRLLIYSDSGSVPNALLGTSSATAVDNSAVGLAVSPVAVTSGLFYWLFLLPTGGNANLTLVTGGGQRGKNIGVGVTTGPNPWVTAGDGTSADGIPIQGEGTAGGGAIIKTGFGRIGP
jgi:hypothetical protein